MHVYFFTFRLFNYLLLCISDKTISFQELSSANTIYFNLLAFSAFIITLSLLHILRYSQTIAVMAATIRNSGGQLAAFGLFCVAFILAFASVAHLSFGSNLYDYRSLWSSFVRLAIYHMDMDYENAREVAGPWGALVMLIYVCVTLIVLLNFFITFINDALAALQEEKREGPQEDDFLQHIMSKFSQRVSTQGEAVVRLYSPCFNPVLSYVLFLPMFDAHTKRFQKRPRLPSIEVGRTCLRTVRLGRCRLTWPSLLTTSSTTCVTTTSWDRRRRLANDARNSCSCSCIACSSSTR